MESCVRSGVAGRVGHHLRFQFMLIPTILTTMGGARDIDGVAGNVMNVDADVGDIFEGDYDGVVRPVM